MNALERYWLAPIPAVRTWLVVELLLLVFALDVFREHLRAAWRYGAADFNVAHFAVLDALPAPSVSAYVGAMIAMGLAAFVVALVPRPPRVLPIAIAIVYAWSWSCSMLDSWQHHYLLSLFLVAIALCPRLSAAALFDGRPRGGIALASSFGLVVLWSTAAIVYGWSAIAKLDPGWLDGTALRTITGDGASIPVVVATLSAIGIDGDATWRVLARGVIALELVCMLGYALAPLRERATGRVRIALEIVAWCSLVLALAFHVGTAFLDLEIGWFGAYMALLALATFLPAPWLDRTVERASGPARRLSRWSASPRVARALAAIACAALAMVGVLADLPGALAACLLAAATLAAVVVVTPRAPALASGSIALLVGAAALLAMLSIPPDVRLEHWRRAGGDFRRRGEWARALDAYQHANAHAATPEDRRDDRIDELRERIDHGAR